LLKKSWWGHKVQTEARFAIPSVITLKAMLKDQVKEDKDSDDSTNENDSSGSYAGFSVKKDFTA
jgi:hypothetical protein